jgi:hypothetical protein
MVKSFKVNTAILCEHALKSENNKNTLINIYSGDILVSALPAILYFGLYLELQVPPHDDLDISADIRVGGKTQFAVKATLMAGDTQPAANLLVPLFSLHIADETEIKVLVSIPGQRAKTALTKRILRAPDPQ